MFGIKNKLDVPEIHVEETPLTGERILLKFQHDSISEKTKESQSLLLKIGPHKGSNKTLSESSLSLHSSQSCISLTVRDSPVTDADIRTINLNFSTPVRGKKECADTSL